MLHQDRNGRFHRPGGGFASRAEIARARKVAFADKAGRVRTRTGKQARARAARPAPLPKPKVKGTVRTVFTRRSRTEKTKAQERLAKRRGVDLEKTPRFRRLGRKGRSKLDTKREGELEKAFGLVGKLRGPADFATLLQLQPEEERIYEDSFSIRDPYSERAEYSIYKRAEELARAILNHVRREEVFAITTTLNANGLAEAAEVALVGPRLQEITGAIVKTIMAQVEEAGFYVSDNGKKRLQGLGASRGKLKNLEVTVSATRLRGEEK